MEHINVKTMKENPFLELVAVAMEFEEFP